MSDHTDTLTDTERDSLTECECGHYLNEHSSDGCLATAYDGDDGMASLDDVCACMATPDLIRERAIVAIVAARVAAARADERAKRDAEWRALLEAHIQQRENDRYVLHGVARFALRRLATAGPGALIEGADHG